MESTGFAHWLVVLVELVTAFALLLLALAVVVLAVTWVVDRNQTGNAVLRNFPVIGHFRYWFLHLGEFFRQYLYSSDREEMPFNRAQRTWSIAPRRTSTTPTRSAPAATCVPRACRSSSTRPSRTWAWTTSSRCR